MSEKRMVVAGDCALDARDGELGSPAIGQPRAYQRPETMRLYAAEWLAFVAWCRAAKRVALPANAETLAAYLLAAAGKAGRGALGRKRAAIRGMHRQYHLPEPAFDAAARASVRLIATSVTAKASRTPLVGRPTAALMQMAVMCPLDLAGLRDRALLLLAAVGSATHDEVLGLERERLRFVEAGLELQLVRGAAETVSVLVRRGTAAACPVRALEAWLDASATRFGPVFRKVDRWGNVEHARLGPDGLRRIVTRRSSARSRRDNGVP